MSTLSQTGIPGIGNGILMPKRKNLWRVLFSKIGGNANDSKNLSMQAVNVTRPNLQFEEIPVHRYNSTAYVAAKHSWQPMTLTLEDDVTGLASQVIQDQLEIQQKLIGADGPFMESAATATAYKFNTTLDMLDGGSRVLERWKIEGCWLTSVDYGNGDYSVSEASQITMNVRFDHARQELSGSGLGTAIGGTQ